MKAKIALLLAALALPVSATVTMNTVFGVAKDKDGVAIAQNTLYVLVADSNTSSSFAGGMGLGTTLTVEQANSASGFTIGQTLALGGQIGGDTIFYMGGFTQSGGISDAVIADFTLGANGTAAGRNFVIYWFPGVSFNASGTNAVGSQVGGVHTNTNTGVDAMVLPADGALVDIGAATAGAGGTLADDRFVAVQLIPEPSTALLGLLGIVGLLRRRR